MKGVARSVESLTHGHHQMSQNLLNLPPREPDSTLGMWGWRLERARESTKEESTPGIGGRTGLPTWDSSNLTR